MCRGCGGPCVGTIDFDHDDAVSPEVPGQTGAVGAGALDSHLPDRAMLVEPPQQLPIPRRGGRELSSGEAASDLVDGRGVMGIPVLSTPPMIGLTVEAVLVTYFLGAVIAWLS
jgi:hypothetical protein